MQTEIVWCVKQFEQSLASGKLTEKKAADAMKSIKILKNPQSKLIKIRQVMRTNFGDYRAKMAAEEKSAGKLDHGKVKEVKSPPAATATGSSGEFKSDKVTFIKKSASKAGTKDQPQKTEFKFAFNVGK